MRQDQTSKDKLGWVTKANSLERIVDDACAAYDRGEYFVTSKTISHSDVPPKPCDYHKPNFHLGCSDCMVDNVLISEEFSNINPLKWQRIIDAVKAKTGIAIVELSSQASAKGITLTWHMDTANQRLTLGLVHRSWYDPSVEDIDTQMKAWVNAA